MTLSLPLPPSAPPAPRDDLLAWARAVRQQSQASRARASELREQTSARPARAVTTELRLVRDRAQNLERALLSNRRIGMAVGILMERHRIPEEAAFELLRSASSHTNTKLATVAEQVVYTGSLPG